MKLIKILFVCISTLYPLISQAESNEQYYEVGSELAKCAAFHDVLAMNMTKSDAEFKEHFMHELANGGKIASEYLMQAAGYKKELADSIYHGALSRNKALVQTGGFDRFVSDNMTVAKECVALNEIQSAIIKEFRKQAYSQ